MKKELNIPVTPQQAAEMQMLKQVVATNLRIDKTRIKEIIVRRRSIDARNVNIKVNLGLDVFVDEIDQTVEKPHFDYPNIANGKPVVIVGAGPAGLFAALRLIESGFKPIILERGKSVSERKRDIHNIHIHHIVDADSNYGFGEGGAGTFSDGKLYTRSKKRGDIRKVLEVLHFHGAQDEILIDAHPHIGTNVLPRVISAIRQTILDAGGEYHFQSRVVDLVKKDGAVRGVKLADGDVVEGIAVVLATGHSARDIYRLLDSHQLMLEGKPFAMGVRVEHNQDLIDRIQYHGSGRGQYLPPAAYSFTEQVNHRGVYSFCMCPGGVVVPAATAPGELVVNGMSPSSRGGKFANSGMVAEIRLEDIPAQYRKFGELAGLAFQEELEKQCFAEAGNSQFAPAQRMIDFIQNRASAALPETSYRPGIVLSEMHRWLPEHIRLGLQQGLQQIGAKNRGYLTNDAILLGVESRTSSPVRIPRDPESFQHLQLKGLFPCGEGAGYAGGIVSSAVDGERVAERIASLYK